MLGRPALLVEGLAGLLCLRVLLYEGEHACSPVAPYATAAQGRAIAVMRTRGFGRALIWIAAR